MDLKKGSACDVTAQIEPSRTKKKARGFKVDLVAGSGFFLLILSQSYTNTSSMGDNKHKPDRREKAALYTCRVLPFFCVPAQRGAINDLNFSGFV